MSAEIDLRLVDRHTPRAVFDAECPRCEAPAGEPCRDQSAAERPVAGRAQYDRWALWRKGGGFVDDDERRRDRVLRERFGPGGPVTVEELEAWAETRLGPPTPND